jgi:hypothetical protein
MKGWDKPVGKAEIASHLVNVYGPGWHRCHLHIRFWFTQPAIESVKTALVQKVRVLCELKETAMLLEKDGDPGEMLRRKDHAARMYKNPCALVPASVKRLCTYRL